MDITELKALIANDEHRTLEIKKSTGELKEAMHTACAFLNTDGGWLVFGVTPVSLKIIGQDVTDNTQREIALAVSGLQPMVDVCVKYIDVPDSEGKKVVVMHFEAFVWGRIPYTFHGCPYIKIESTTKEMPRDMFEERLRASKPRFFAWERQRAERIGIGDINEPRVRGLVKLGVDRGRMAQTAVAEPIDVVLDKLQLLRDGEPNNAAAALFGTNNYEYPQFRLRMARFSGNDKNEFIDNRSVDGSIFDLLDEGMAFFFKHLSLSGIIDGVKRKEMLEIPVEALREALVNALCHRQYEKDNLTIGIAIYDDRVEIENPGHLPPQLTPESIRQPHISYPYNPIIADVLYKTTFLEKWGSGAERIIAVCKKQSIPEPFWKEQGGFVVVVFPRLSTKTEKLVTSLSPACHQFVTQLDGNIKTLIISVGDNEFTIPELQELINLSPKSRRLFKQKYVDAALAAGVVSMLYPDNPHHPRQKYFLSAEGKRLFDILKKS